MIRNLIVGSSLIVAILTAIIFGVFVGTPLTIPAQGYTFDFRTGSSFKQLTNNLQQKNITSSAIMLQIIARAQGIDKIVQAGEYHLEPGVRPNELLDMLANGRVKQYRLTIVEGWNFKQILNEIKQHVAVIHTTNDFKVYSMPEGKFYPETYKFPKGTKDVDILNRSYNAMQDVLMQEWIKRNNNLIIKTPYEALILASIIEKESSMRAEFNKISGVYQRRLAKKMRLQADPTVIYGLANDSKILTKKDLKINTKYNTYMHYGLPPTPIAMPSRAAIYAALHPDDSDNIYFVARGDGGHVFSENLQQHLQAVNRYRRLNGR